MIDEDIYVMICIMLKLLHNSFLDKKFVIALIYMFYIYVFISLALGYYKLRRMENWLLKFQNRCILGR